MKRKKWFMCVVTTTSVWTAVAPVHFFILWNWLKPGAINATATLICGDILCDYSLTWKKKWWFLNYLLITISSKPTQTETCFFFPKLPIRCLLLLVLSPFSSSMLHLILLMLFFFLSSWKMNSGSVTSGSTGFWVVSFLLPVLSRAQILAWPALVSEEAPPPQPPMEIDRVGVGPALPCHFHNQCPKSLKQRQEVSNISSLLK